ncbi:hypothetical protein V1264_003719 [Littorina saxatilis]|uniref:Uncharacterized protein n=1 Tax=Littorina saxatilis TaxID=31220 RepID=A0AAN9G9L8_9CAEN
MCTTFQDSEDLGMEREEIVYRPVGFLKNYSRNYKGYESRLSTGATLTPTQPQASSGHQLMDSMITTGRQVITSTPPSKCSYTPDDQVFAVCKRSVQPQVWKDMPPVLQPEVTVATEKSASGTPVPTWSYRRETHPPSLDEGPPKLRRMVPSPITSMLRDQEQQGKEKDTRSGFVPIRPKAPPSLQPQSPLVVSQGGVTKVTSTIHQSGGIVRPVAVPGVVSPEGKPAPRVVSISREDYLRLLQQNKIKVVQQAPGGKGQVIQLQAGLQIITQKGAPTPATAPLPTATIASPAASVTVACSSEGSKVISTVSPAGGMKKAIMVNPWSVTDSSQSRTSTSAFSPSKLAPLTGSGANSVSSAVITSPAVSSAITASSPRVRPVKDPVMISPRASVRLPQSPSTSATTPPVSSSPAGPTPLRGKSHTEGGGSGHKLPESIESCVKTNSHKQSAGYGSKSDMSGDQDSDGSGDQDSGESGSDGNATDSSPGVNRSVHRDGQEQKRSSVKRKNDDSDSGAPLAKSSRPSGGSEKSVASNVKTSPPGQKAVPQINLTGLSSQLASAMARKRKQCSPEPHNTSPPKQNHTSPNSGANCSSSSVSQAAASAVDQENLSAGDPMPEDSLNSSDETEGSDMEAEDLAGPPRLEAASVPPSTSARKGGEVTPPRLKASGSVLGKSPLKHADSNIFQRMLDMSSGESPGKSAAEDPPRDHGHST